MAESNLAAAITALVISYQSARDLLQSVRLLDNHWQKTPEEVAKEQGLVDALRLGENSVSRRYNAIYSELGEQYRMGDGTSQEKLLQIAQLVDGKISKILQQAIKLGDCHIDYERLTQHASLFGRAALGILEQLRQLFLPEVLCGDGTGPAYTGPAGLRPNSGSSEGSHSRGSVDNEAPVSEEPQSVPRQHTRPVSSPIEQSMRFKKFLSGRKAKREACLHEAPAELSLERHFEWQGSETHTQPTKEKREAHQSTQSWRTGTESLITADGSPLPSKPQNLGLGVWEQWRQSHHMVAGHVNIMDARSSGRSTYSPHKRSSSVYSSEAGLSTNEHALRGRLDDPIAEDRSSTTSGASAFSHASTPLTSPGSPTDSCDWDHASADDTRLSFMPFAQAPPEIPARSPLRTLARHTRHPAESAAPLPTMPGAAELRRQVSHVKADTPDSSVSTSSFAGVMRATPRLRLPEPSKANSYHGFCKAAWSIRKSPDAGLKLQTRPSGMYNKTSFFQCRSCSYRLPDLPGKSAAIDARVYTTAGVLYRQIFLAKSHVKCNSGDSHGFGCLFCCAEGRPGCNYGSVDTLMGHIVGEHAGWMDWGVQEETNCVFGRVASPREDFDICIPLTSSRRPLFASAVQALEG